jgi:anti-sigma regulatory factor (Ser/Thr protein kinase)
MTQVAQTALYWGQGFSPMPQSVGRARREARSALQDWQVPEDVVDTVVLLISELVTNGIRACPRGRLVHVALTAGQCSVLLEVSDPSRILPMRVEAGDEDDSGRGLLLVERLADSSGVRPRPVAGKTVWARCWWGDEAA